VSADIAEQHASGYRPFGNCSAGFIFVTSFGVADVIMAPYRRESLSAAGRKQFLVELRTSPGRRAQPGRNRGGFMRRNDRGYRIRQSPATQVAKGQKHDVKPRASARK